MTTPPRLPRSRRLRAGDAYPAGHKLHSRRASLRSYHPDTIRSRGSRRRTGACDLKEHPSPPAATVLGRLRPGPTLAWLAAPVSSSSVAVLGRLRVTLWVPGLFRVEPTSLVNLGSVRSTWASVITVRELRHGEVETLATVSRRAHLARQSRLSTKHVGFRHSCARALTRGGGDAGDRFASSSPRLVSFSSKLSSDRSTWASLTSVCELWREEVNTPATALRRAPFASQPRPGMKRVGFRYSARALAQGWGSAGG